MYDYYLGGKDNFAIDRETAEKALQSWPTGPIAAKENRGFPARAVSYLVREAGIRQFLDIGTGLPSADNTHEVAQRLRPERRVVYVDNDGMEADYRAAGVTVRSRSADEFGRMFFSGLELVPPGVVLTSEWRPTDAGPRARPEEVNAYGAVARKPG